MPGLSPVEQIEKAAALLQQGLLTAAEFGALKRQAIAAALPDEAAWEAQLTRLEAYKEVHGDCDVPKRWTEDPRLGTWVHDQRARKKKLDRGDPSPGMTAARAARLEALGFAWAAVGTALSRGATKRNCEDCEVVVAGGAANSGHGGSAVSLRLAVPKLA
jgi:hypothetical protein